MSEFPDTRESLLLQVRDPENREAWDQFAQIYRPIIFRTALARGLQDADAHDLAQKVLIAVASAIGRSLSPEELMIYASDRLEKCWLSCDGLVSFEDVRDLEKSLPEAPTVFFSPLNELRLGTGNRGLV